MFCNDVLRGPQPQNKNFAFNWNVLNVNPYGLISHFKGLIKEKEQLKLDVGSKGGTILPRHSPLHQHSGWIRLGILERWMRGISSLSGLKLK